MTDPGPERVRLDRWLWAARFYKTRSMAARAIAGGKIRVGSNRPKRSTAVAVGDEIRVRKPPYDFVVIVRGLAERRGPAREAVKLYDETAESRRARQRLAIQMKNVPVPSYEGKGRPTKKERRELDRLKRLEHPEA